MRFLLFVISVQAMACMMQLPGRFHGFAEASVSAGVEKRSQQSAERSEAAEMFGRGKRALQDGELAGAEHCFRRVIELDPGSAAAHTNLGVVYMRDRKWDDAIQELKQAHLLRPADAGVDLNMGLAYYRKGDFSSAIEPFRSSLEKSVDSLQARYLLGLSYFFTSDFKLATDTLIPLWTTNENNLSYLYVLSIAASKASDAVTQKKAFDRMLRVGQDTPEFHLYLGKAWLAEGDTEKALQEFKSATSAQPTLPLVHYFTGKAYLEQRRYDLAIQELLKGVEVEPDLPYNYEELGVVYTHLGNLDKAEEFYNKALSRNAFLVNSCFGLAKIYRTSGRFREALAMLDRVEAMAPQSASLHYLKGQVLARLGDAKNAQQEFTRSAELLHAFNDRLQQNGSGDTSADAQSVAEQ